MATELHVNVYPNPYRGHEVRFWWNGMLNRYSFELRTELACKLVDDSVEQCVIDTVMDSLDAFEWQENPVYPLGVVCVGEAVSDCCCGPGEFTVTFDDEPVYTNVRPADEPSPFWEWAAATLRIGAVTAPWVAVILLGRFVWGWM